MPLKKRYQLALIYDKTVDNVNDFEVDQYHEAYVEGMKLMKKITEIKAILIYGFNGIENTQICIKRKHSNNG